MDRANEACRLELDEASVFGRGAASSGCLSCASGVLVWSARAARGAAAPLRTPEVKPAAAAVAVETTPPSIMPS